MSNTESKSRELKGDENFILAAMAWGVRVGIVPIWLFSILKFFLQIIGTFDTINSLKGFWKFIEGLKFQIPFPVAGAWIFHKLNDVYDFIITNPINWVFKNLKLTISPLILTAAVAIITTALMLWIASRHAYKALELRKALRVARMEAYSKQNDIEYKHSGAVMLGGAGAGAVAGFLIGGPPGALIGGIIGMFGMAAGVELEEDASRALASAAEKNVLDLELAVRATFVSAVRILASLVLILLAVAVIYFSGIVR